jgi:tetratricopeptide (TPR) repeat protein
VTGAARSHRQYPWYMRASGWLFRTQHYEQAAEEFRAVIDRAPTNDFALFCLGRCLQLMGRHAEARQPLALAACLQPSRSDYRVYRDRARARAAETPGAS